MLTAILFVVMLLVLVIPHEWGHMMVAKKCGVKVLEFSAGMGPLLFKKQKGDTQYSVRLLPLGGYCMMEGEEQAVDSPTSYSSKSYGQKIAILLAGVTMNIIIAVIAVAVAACISGVVTNSIDSVTPGSPAEAAGLRAGDEIVAINGEPTDSWEDVVSGISAYKEGDKLMITVDRDGSEQSMETVPEYSDELQSYAIGIRAGVSHNIWQCIKTAPAATWSLSKAILKGFQMLITGNVSRNDVAGPIGLVKVVDTAVDYGVGSYFILLAMVSLNLALFNILPVPGLDGGKIFFIFLKIISGGRINDDMEYKATLAGMALLLMFFVLVTFNDVMNIFGK